jgi:hypothetical protein
MSTTLRWKGPWESESVDQVPEGHKIVAEFPNVVWGWEGDLYCWIIEDPSGRQYIGGTSHGGFCEVKLSNIQEDIDTHYAMAETLEKVYACVISR